jgi:uncharacterized repeat protein (TIGR01451 family)
MLVNQLSRGVCRSWGFVMVAVVASLLLSGRPAVMPVRGQPAGLTLAHSFATVEDSGEMAGTVAVGNVDDDPALEIVVNSYEGIHVYDYDGTLVSNFSTHDGTRNRQVNIPPSLYDIDGDGREEIIFATGNPTGDSGTVNAAFALDGDGTKIWERPIDRTTYSAPDSGYQTIQGKFYYNDAEHTQLPSEAALTCNISAMPVHDIDGDGQLETVMVLKIDPEPVQDYNPYINDVWGGSEWGTRGESWSGGNFILNAQTGQRDYVYHFVQLAEAGVALGTVDPAKGVAVFTLTDSDSVVGYHRTDPHGFYGAGNLIGQFGKNARLLSGSYKRSTTLNAVDLTGDGRVEVLYEAANVGDPNWQPSSVIFDDYGRILWREWYTVPPTTGTANHWPNAAQMIPLNLDGGNPEVVSWHHTGALFYEEWDGVELVSKGGNWPVSFGSNFPSPPAVGDVDGDGQEEFVVAVYNPFDLADAGELVVLGQDGSVEQAVDVTSGLKNVPNLYDVDQDGDLDVIVRALDGTILIYDTGSGGPGQVTWATEYRSAARTGALGMCLYDREAPAVGQVTEGYRRVRLEWSMETTTGLTGFDVYRRVYGQGGFTLVASLGSGARQFEDGGLDNGTLYVYRIDAIHGGQAYPSAPVPAVPLVENNLARNSGMELNGDNGWDKWYTGDIGWADMTKTTAQQYRGVASMRIHLDDKGDNSSIKQYNQYGVIDAQLPVTPGKVYSLGAFVKTDLNRSSTHRIEWSSTYDKYRHDPVNDPVPFGDYPFYFSTHVETGPGESDWFYTNRTFTMQDGITALSPRHRFYIDGDPASGDVYLDDVFFREVGTGGAGALTLLPFESHWRYFEGTAPVGWYLAGFDDSGWLVGQAKFGAGSGPDNVNAPLPQYRDRFYFRTTFAVSTTNLSELVAYGKSTTGPDLGPGIKEIYLNGHYVPIQDPGLTDDPGNDVRLLDLTPFIDYLDVEQNVVAIKLENRYNATWDDVAFDLQIKALETPALGLRVRKQAHPSRIEAGDLLTYTIEVDNLGPSLTSVRITDTVPAPLSYYGNLWASSGSYGEAGGTVTWVGDLNTGEGVTLVFAAELALSATDPAALTNTAWVDDGVGAILPAQVTVLANYWDVYLPLVSRN